MPSCNRIRFFAVFVALFGATLRAETAASPFSNAERLVDRGQFAAALQEYARLHDAYPERRWPRDQRHFEAYAMFRLGKLEAAQARWGALLCESHRDSLSFRIAYNLALAEQQLKQTDRAYWTRLLVPGPTVLAQPPANQAAYFELAGMVASDLGKHDIAEQVYLTAAKHSKNSRERDKFNALAKYQRKLPVRRVAAEPVGTSFKNLWLAPLGVEPVMVVGAPEATLRVDVVGRWLNADRELFCGGIPVAVSPTGDFRLNAEIADQTAALFLMSVPKKGAVDFKIETFANRDWAHFQPTPLAREIASALETKPTAASSGESRWKLLRFGILGRVLFPGTGENAFYPEPQWLPAYRIGGVELAAHLGFFSGKTARGLDSKLVLGLMGAGLRIEVGGGAQVDGVGTYPQASVAFGFDWRANLFGGFQIESLVFGGEVLSMRGEEVSALTASLRFAID
jgi:hypothetical protein